MERILIVGFGAMTGAMVDGWLRAGYDAARFEVYHPSRREVAHGLRVHNEWPAASYDAVLLGVKPNMLDDVADGVRALSAPGTVLLSVLAGRPLSDYTRRFPGMGGVVRFMPNLACAIRKSPSALFGTHLNEVQRDDVTRLAEDIGTAEWLDDESRFDLVTALAGSGPGFVYRFIDALAGGAADLGLDRAQAERLAVAMVEGAGALAAASGLSPRDLAARVASPGGMTQMGLEVLDDGCALDDLMHACLRAARNRGRAMADEGAAKA